MAKFDIDAKEALAEIKSLVQQMKALKKVINSVKNDSEGSYDEVTSSVKRLKKELSDLTNKKKYLEAILKKEQATQKKATKATRKSTKATDKDTRATRKNSKAKNRATKNTKKATKANKSLALSLRTLLKGYGAFAGVNFLREILIQTYEQIKSLDSLRFALKLLNENVVDYNNANRFMLDITSKFGAELIPTTNRFIKFSAAAKNSGLSLRETENIFKSMTKAGGALGLQTDELSGIYLALEQMLSKGKVTTEELRRQLGERLPGAFGIMAASLGVTLPKLDDMLRKGEVLSAEVLPDFADAVEVAFGIDKVEKIDTLVAAENRLTTAWQNFVKTVTGSESVITKSIEGILNTISTAADSLTWVFGGQETHLEYQITQAQDMVLKSLRKYAKDRIEITTKSSRDDLAIEKDLAKQKSLLASTGDLRTRAVIKKEINELKKELIEYNKLLKETEVQIGKENFKDMVAPYEEALEKYNKIIKDFEEVSSGKKVKGLFNQEDLDAAEAELAVATAYYNVYRKFVDESEVNSGNSGESGSKKASKYLKDVDDLNKKFAISILETRIENNEALINSDKTTFEEKIKLTKQNNNDLLIIAELQKDIEIEKAEQKEKDKIAAIKKAQKEGRTFEGNDPDEQILDLQKQKNTAIEIAEEKLSKKIISINKSTYDEINNIIKDSRDQYVQAAQDKYNLEIIAAKEAFDLSKKTAQDEEILQNKLKRISIEKANAMIDAQIAIREAILSTEDISDDAIAKLIMEINELKASKQQLIEGNDDLLELEEDFWNDFLYMIAEMSASAGNLIDSLHQRKIENINAEIEAEKRKYDKLISLAENDAEQQKTLRRNKDEAIQKLERKRLKEEQKQAKARKAFAIADVGISLAQGIMRIWSTHANNPIMAGILTGLITATAALQTAAIIAEPIPQYKDGGEIKKDEIAMINDGGKKEYVKRGNSILTTNNKNAIVNLKENDTVYKDYDDMINKELLKPNNIGSIKAKEPDFNKLFLGINSSIIKGFKKAKVNSIVNIVQNNNDEYRNKLSRW